MKAFLAAFVGLALTAMELVLTNTTGAEWMAWVLLLPWALLSAVAPHPNIGTPDHPLYEGTPFDLAAAAIGLPLSALINIGIAYLIIRRLWKSRSTDRAAV